MNRRTLLTLALTCCPVLSGTAELRAEDLFQDRVAPIFQRRCLNCHNDRQREGDFSLQSVEAALADGYVEPGDAGASHLLEVITPKNGRAVMPRDADPLSAEEV